MDTLKQWGSAYYAEKSAPVHMRGWAELLKEKYPNLKEDVDRSVKRWNQQVRDHLRNETALRLTVGTDTAQVPVSVVDGLPAPFAEILKEYEELAPLLLNRETLRKTVKGLQITEEHFGGLCAVIPPDNLDKGNVRATHQWLTQVIARLDNEDIIKRLASIRQDILGAYFFNEPKIEIYWMAIGIASALYGIPVEALTVVVLSHELAHAYTHLGKDIDGKKWDTNAFACSELEIVEGLAQFYTQVVCKKLQLRFPAALEAYSSLLKHQSGPYKVQDEWAKGTDHRGEVIRFSMVHARTSKVQEYEKFKEIINNQAEVIGQ